VKYLIDTDWIADHLNGRPIAVQLLASLVDEGIAISLMTYGEIYEGIIWGRRPEATGIVFLQLLRWTRVLPLDESVMRRFAGIRGGLRRRGQIIGDPDILIAATALHYDLTLVTRNHDHFRRVPDLKIYQAN
jgi:predicted nucleic acid-binding protein